MNVNNSIQQIPDFVNKINDINKEKFKNNNIDESSQGFSEILKGMLYDANTLKKGSDVKTADFMAGKTDNIHEVMIAAQKAEVSISFVTEVRNRILDAYQEFSRMQI